MASKPPILIKKYGNRRLYDTSESRYITLEELSRKIQAGADARVVDAKSGKDLTQPTLTQIIIEGRGAAKLLPVSLLIQLIRLGDDALAEFFGRYVTGALDVYLQVKRGAHAVTAYNPFASLPFTASDALARMWMNTPLAGGPAASQPPPPHSAPIPVPEAERAPEPAMDVRNERNDDVAALRRELEELKRSMQSGANQPAEKKKPRKPRRRKAPAKRRG